MADDATERGGPVESAEPLAGMRIVDPPTIRPCPAASRTLVDPGADVICHG